MKLEAFNNMKNLSSTHFLKFEHWNIQQFEELSSTNFLKFERWNIQQFEKLSSTHFLKFERWNSQQLEKYSSTLENLQHFVEVSSTPPTHSEKLQALCMPPLGNELPLILQTKKPFSRKDSLLSSMQYKLKTLDYFLF